MTRSLFIHSFILLTAAVSLPAQSLDYFPLNTGNRWVYRANRLGGSTVVEVTGKKTVNGQEYSVVNGWFGAEETLLRRTESGMLVEYSANEGAERVWVNFSSPVGAIFATSAHPCSTNALIRVRGSSGLLHVAYLGNLCADAGLVADVYAPGVGLFSREETTIAGPRTHQLVYARVDGAVVMNSPEFSFALSLDSPVYERNAPIFVRLTLRNETRAPLPLTFPSSQDFNLEVRNAAGETVYHWAADKLFLAQIREVDIRGEKNWDETLRLNLAPGRYSIRGSITDSAKSFEAVSSFEVK